MTADKTERDWVEEIGKPTFDNLAEMVAALECDYERLEELREEKADYQERDKSEPLTESWAQANPDDADELKELEEAAGECKDREEADQRIHEDPLSVEVRSGWVTPGAEMEPEDFCILLGTGGPATRIRGELDQHGEPHRAWLEVQDWYKPWTEYVPASQDVLLAYARCFCFAS